MGRNRKRKRMRRPPSSRRPYCPACRKMAFPTLATARAAIRAMERSGKAELHPRAGELLNAYLCPRRSGWHVGHSGEVKPWLKRRKGA